MVTSARNESNLEKNCLGTPGDFQKCHLYLLPKGEIKIGVPKKVDLVRRKLRRTRVPSGEHLGVKAAGGINSQIALKPLRRKSLGRTLKFRKRMGIEERKTEGKRRVKAAGATRSQSLGTAC